MPPLKKNQYTATMKKIVMTLAMVLSFTLVNAQTYEEALELKDSISVDYVPNSFADNWEINFGGGVSVLFDGLGHNALTQTKPGYECVGGIGEISATKWFSPYVAARLGWMSGYLPYNATKTIPANSTWGEKTGAWHNYVHIDMLWDWSTQFGGIKNERIYSAVPYVHVGLLANPRYNVMVAGGIGLLNRFRINDHWLFNIDLRATATTARKFGLEKGIAVETDALIGFSYRFNTVGWDKKVAGASPELVRDLRSQNAELADNYSRMKAERDRLQSELANKQLELSAEQRAHQELVGKGITVVNGQFQGIPDTLQLTVYFPISSHVLSVYEQAHLNSYIKLIEKNDPNHKHRYLVIGTADAGTGTEEFNQRLSQRRAEYIKSILIKAGIEEQNIQMQTQLVNEGDPKLGRASHVVIYPL